MHKCTIATSALYIKEQKEKPLIEERRMGKITYMEAYPPAETRNHPFTELGIHTVLDLN
jgi:hypothetical protein